MSSKTEELLNMLLWTAETLVRPTFRNLSESYEGWAHRKGLLQRIARLEHHHLIERDSNSANDRIVRLTTQGRLRALGGRDPLAHWARPWDGQWRIALFDVSNRRNARRARLRRYLKNKGFGCLQKSVWIAPDPIEDERRILRDTNVDAGSLLLVEARPCAGESDGEIVAAAWDFESINRRYTQHMRILRERPTGSLRSEAVAKALLRWASTERATWLAAVCHDPLLPGALLPGGYLGKRAWRQRMEVLRDASRQIDTFGPG